MKTLILSALTLCISMQIAATDNHSSLQKMVESINVHTNSKPDQAAHEDNAFKKKSLRKYLNNNVYYC